MCGLCGVFSNADHWSSGTDLAPSLMPGVELGLQAAAANAVLALHGLKLKVWSGRFMLSGHTGKTVIVDNLGSLWREAEKLTGRSFDPLDANLLDRLEAKRI